MFGTAYEIAVMYLRQLMGLAMGISAKKLGIGTELISPKAGLECVARKPAAAVPAHNVKVGQP